MEKTMTTNLLLNGKIVGVLLAEDAGSDPNLAPVLIDPRALALVAEAANPNWLSEEEFDGLVRSIDKLKFSQSPAFYCASPWRVTAAGIELGTPTVLDGNHRVKASCLLNLPHIPCTWYRIVQPGEEKVIRIALNRHRGNARVDIERQLIREAAEAGWSIADLAVTGYPEVRIESIIGEVEAPQVQLQTEQVAAFIPETESTTETEDGKSGVLEIKTRSASETKHIKNALQRAARAAKAKGTYRLTEGLLRLIRQAEGEEDPQETPESDD
jgi:hypothetical protein